MTQQAVEALEVERDEVLRIARTFTADEWQMASDCEGWRVRDVVAHLSLVNRQVADPGGVPSTDSDNIEDDIEAAVATMRDASDADVLTAYETWSAKGLDALRALQAPPMADTVVPLKNLGSHPLHLLADALVFDAYCHLHNDILAPIGPIERDLAPPDALRLRPILTWMLAGLPQMNADALRPVLAGPVVLDFTGPGGGTWTLTPNEGAPAVEEGKDIASATIVTTVDAFIVWGTRRRDWRDVGIEIDGDETLGAAVADAIRII